MKYLNSYEKDENWLPFLLDKLNDILIDVCFYLENLFPVKTNVLYAIDNHRPIVPPIFYCEITTEEDNIKLTNYLKENKFKIIKSYKKYEIYIIEIALSVNKTITYSKLYNSINKYNL